MIKEMIGEKEALIEVKIGTVRGKAKNDTMRKNKKGNIKEKYKKVG